MTGLDSRKSYGDDDSGVEFDLKRARHEIKRFGISGLDKVAKDEAQVQLAIRLGAKVIIGIDHDTVCAGVVGTAIRNSTSCAGRRAAAPAGTTSAVPHCSTNHDSADRISGQFLFYHDHNLQKVRETCVFDFLYRCSSPSAFA